MRAGWGLGIFLGLTLATVLPFSGLPEAFRKGVQFYAGEANAIETKELFKYIGLVVPLREWGIFWMQRPLQLSGLLIAVYLVVRRANLNLMDGLALGGMSYFTLLIFVTIPFHYVYAETLQLVTYLFITAGFSGQKIELDGRTPLC